MESSENIIDELLNDESFQSFALGLNPDDEVHWQNWMSQNPNKQKAARQAIEILRSFSIKTLEIDPKKYDQDLQRLKTLVSEEKEAKVIPMKRRTGLLMKIAASVLLVMSIGYAAYYFQPADQELPEIASMEKSTPRGQKSTIMLFDGTKVNMNSESHLKYEENPETGSRTVYLTGEAYFEVAKDSSRPFTVYAGNIATTAVGTAFNVKAYDDDNTIQVFLVTGKVEIKNIKNDIKLMLDPGEGISYNRTKDELWKRNFDYREIMAWKRGAIIFEKAGLNEIVEELGRWYGVDFKIEGKPQQPWRINGEFKNESLENVLNSIGYTTSFDYTIAEDTVTIKF